MWARSAATPSAPGVASSGCELINSSARTWKRTSWRLSAVRRSTSVAIDVVIDGAALVLRVTDDGVGICNPDGSGNGLANMRDRAESLGGRCEIGSPTAGGTSVEWRVPIDGVTVSD